MSDRPYPTFCNHKDRLKKVGCFDLFAAQVRDQMRRENKGTFVSHNDVVHAASEQWAEICDDEKEYWKNEAREFKNALRNGDETFINAQIRRFPKLFHKQFWESERNKKVEQHLDFEDEFQILENMNSKRRKDRLEIFAKLVWACNNERERLVEINFVFVSVQHYYEEKRGFKGFPVYCPAEMSAVVWNWERGISEWHTWLFQQPDVSCLDGESREEVSQRSCVHGLFECLDPLENTISTAFKAYNTLKQLIHENSYVFCFEAEYLDVCACLEYLCKKQPSRAVEPLLRNRREDMYCVEDLFGVVMIWEERSSSDPVVIRDLKCDVRNMAEWEMNLCQYHSKQNQKFYCTLAALKGVCFIMEHWQCTGERIQEESGPDPLLAGQWRAVTKLESELNEVEEFAGQADSLVRTLLEGIRMKNNIERSSLEKELKVKMATEKKKERDLKFQVDHAKKRWESSVTQGSEIVNVYNLLEELQKKSEESRREARSLAESIECPGCK